MIHLLALSGSLRATSTNTRLLRALMAVAPEEVEVRLYSGLEELPFFNPDLEGFEPDSVLDFRAQLQAADGIVISSPEYAHGVTGLIKNTLDWLVGSGELVDKPVALLNASARTSIAHESLSEILRTMSAALCEGASITIPVGGTNLDDRGIAAEPKYAELLRSALGCLLVAVEETAART